MMSDTAMAKALGISRMTLWRWRKREGFPAGNNIKKIKNWIEEDKARVRARETAGNGQSQGVLPSTVAGPVSVAQDDRERFRAALAAAYAGSLPWLDELVKKAGYRPGYIVTTRELAGLTGKSKPTIDNWVNSNGMPIEGRSPSGNTFDLARALPWLLGYYNERIEIAREEKRGSSEAVRRTRADANLKELELAKRRGELVDVQEAVAKMAAAAANFTGAFRGKPVDWAQAVEGKAPDAISRYLDGELARIFGELQNTPLPENIPAEAVEHFRAALAAITEPITEKEKGQ